MRWIDSRAADFPADVPGNVEVVVTDVPEVELQDAPAGAFVVVTTHNHALDLTLIQAALARDDWRYLGLIGSVAIAAELLVVREATAQRADAPHNIERMRKR
ncbi:MAG: XdhC family protein [Pseudomonadota bacterium]|nr:XdhC family protein [Pseudomonadota bacterium]